MTQTYAIIGTGAIGGYYGGCLQKSGQEVHFLVRSDYERVKEHGLVIDSFRGDFVLPQVYAYQDAATMPRCDVVIVAVKTTQNHCLEQILPQVVKNNGTVLLLQNGLGAETKVAQIVRPEQVMGGLSFICANKIGPGHIHHVDYGAVKIGQYAPNYEAGGINDKLKQIAADFEAAGV